MGNLCAVSHRFYMVHFATTMVAKWKVLILPGGDESGSFLTGCICDRLRTLPIQSKPVELGVYTSARRTEPQRKPNREQEKKAVVWWLMMSR